MTLRDQLFDQLDGLLGEGIDAGVGALNHAAKTTKSPIERFLLQSAASLVSEHGVVGLALARTQFEALLDGKHLDPAEVRKLPPHQRGALLNAALEREIDARAIGQDTLVAVGSFFGQLVKGLATGALA